MDGEQSVQKGENRRLGKLRIPKQFTAFGGILLVECAVTAILLPLLAYVSFQLRLSTEIIRGGITMLYILPCLLGGCLVRWMKLKPVLLCGVGVGAAFCAVLLVISMLVSGTVETVDPEIAILCVASGAMGALPGLKSRFTKRSMKKSDTNQ